jgi:hypothetical protein
MPIVGSFAGASARAYGLGAGVAIGDYESIATVTAGSAVANIQFTSIPATYTHLQIRGISRFTAASTETNILLEFNNDASAIYADHLLLGTGTTTASGNDINVTASFINTSPAASIASNIFAVNVFDILDYANTNKFKTTKNLTGWDSNGDGYVGLWSGLYRSTNAITSIKLTPRIGNFVQYSSFALYGVKA